MISSPKGQNSTHGKVDSGLGGAIFEDNNVDDSNSVLHLVIYGDTKAYIAAPEILRDSLKSKDTASYFNDVSFQIQSCACYHPYLQPQLVCLVEAIINSPPCHFPGRLPSQFYTALTTPMADRTEWNYDLVSDASRRTPCRIRDYIHLNVFIARLLPVIDKPRDPKQRFSGLNNALFVLSTSLEGHPESLNSPDVEITAAAQYMIHSGTFIFSKCNMK